VNLYLLISAEPLPGGRQTAQDEVPREYEEISTINIATPSSAQNQVAAEVSDRHTYGTATLVCIGGAIW